MTSARHHQASAPCSYRAKVAALPALVLARALRTMFCVFSVGGGAAVGFPTTRQIIPSSSCLTLCSWCCWRLLEDSTFAAAFLRQFSVGLWDRGRKIAMTVASRIPQMSPPPTFARFIHASPAQRKRLLRSHVSIWRHNVFCVNMR